MVLYLPHWTSIGFSFILLIVNLFRHLTLLRTDYSGQAKKEKIDPRRMFWSQIVTYELLIFMLYSYRHYMIILVSLLLSSFFII